MKGWKPAIVEDRSASVLGVLCAQYNKAVCSSQCFIPETRERSRVACQKNNNLGKWEN